MEIYGSGEMFNFSLEGGTRKIFVEEVIPKEWTCFSGEGKKGFWDKAALNRYEDMKLYSLLR